MAQRSQIDVRVISIGTLGRHPLWAEQGQMRTGHATCTLVRSGSAVILVDPGLPPAAMAQRLAERTGLRASDVTHVFLTSFQQDTCRGLGAFEGAHWLIAGHEREQVGVPLIGKLRRASDEGEHAVRDELARQISLLHKCNAAEETLAEGVDLFPLYGITPGLTGLIVETADLTTLICGDALATSEHYAQRKVLPLPFNLDAAKASFGEILQIADVIVPGRDNVMINDIEVGPGEEEAIPRD